MDRKPVEKKRSHNIGLRLTEGEYSKLADNAEGAGMTVSEYVRHAIHGDDINVTYTMQAVFPDVTESIKEMTTEMSHIGNNLNQISRWTNGGGGIAEKTLEYIRKTQQELGDMRRKLADLEGVVNSKFKTFAEEQK